MRLHQLYERRQQAVEIVGVLQTGRVITDAGMMEIDSNEKFQQYLKNTYQIKELGKGFYSIAHRGAGGHEFVIKWHKDPRTGALDAWYRFAEVAKKKYVTNTLYPEILFAGKPAWATQSNIQFAILEHLDIRSEVELNELSTEILGQGTKLEFKVGMQWAMETAKKGFKTSDSDTVRHFFDVLNIDPDEIAEFAQDISNLGGFPDVHPGNIGWRKNGQTVIFDPIS
jgi:hypothetical protein